MLPDGLHPGNFKLLRGHFTDIDIASQILLDSALVTVGANGWLTTLNLISAGVLAQSPLAPDLHRDFISTYLNYAVRLPIHMEEQ